jgi:hypothetical protein
VVRVLPLAVDVLVVNIPRVRRELSAVKAETIKRE